MLKDSGQIIKIDGKDVFVDIREAFTIDKVVFQFRKYNNQAEKGNKITKQVDYYMNLDDFSYFCYCLYTGGIKKVIAESGYTCYGGSVRDGKIYSRILKIEGGEDGKFYLKVQQGPGKKTSTGAITPAYVDNKPETEIILRLTCEQLKKIGLTGERAIRIRDMWVANGCLEEKCSALHFAKTPQPTEDRTDAF